MSKPWFGLASISALLLATAGMCNAQSSPRPQWVGTWATSPMMTHGGCSEHPFCAGTLREIVHVSDGGTEVRVRFTNEFGLDQLIISDAHVALSAGGDSIKPGTDRALTFGGSSTVNIPPGAAMYSDPVKLDVPPLSNLAVSFYLPAQVMQQKTYHALANQENFFANGDQAAALSLKDPSKMWQWYFLDGVDVNAVQGSAAIVAFGDSITDGFHSTPDANDSWPAVLAKRLQQNPALDHVSVLNEGISGNRVLNNGAGPNALSRFDRDVLSQNGVRYLIILESINDIGHIYRPAGPADEITAKELEEALTQMVDAAHEHGIKVYGATLTPFEGAKYYTAKGEQMREAVNQWIRTSGVFDGVIDFDKITRDPQHPHRYNPAYNSGDDLHPNDAGYKAMADGINLAWFK